jgi:molybdenum-dependent DNA-binding transcriptional regulator ModE
VGRPSSITPEQGQELIEAYARLGSISAAARETGVSEDAAGRYLKSVPKAATPVVAQQREIIERAGASLFDAVGALDDNYQRLQGLIRQLEAGITILNGDYTTLTSPSVNVAAYREAREYIIAATKLLELMHSLEEQRKFREAVLEAIGEADDATRKRILATLQQRRSLGIALGGSGATGG